MRICYVSGVGPFAKFKDVEERKGKRTDSPLEPAKGTRPAKTSILAL